MALNTEVGSILQEKEPHSGKTVEELLQTRQRFSEIVREVAMAGALRDESKKRQVLEALDIEVDSEVAGINIDLLITQDPTQQDEFFQRIAELTFLRDRLIRPNITQEATPTAGVSVLEQWRNDPSTLPSSLCELDAYVAEIEVLSVGDPTALAQEAAAREARYNELREKAAKRVQLHQSQNINDQLDEQEYLANLLQDLDQTPDYLLQVWNSELKNIHQALFDAQSLPPLTIDTLTVAETNTHLADIAALETRLTAETVSYRKYPKDSRYAMHIQEIISSLSARRRELEARKKRATLEDSPLYKDALTIDTTPFTPTDPMLPRVIGIFDPVVAHLDTFLAGLGAGEEDYYRDVIALRDRLQQRRDEYQAKLTQIQEAATAVANAPEAERSLNRTQNSVLYFLEQKGVPWLEDLKNELKHGDPNPEYINQLGDLIYTWMSDAINDWKNNRKSERTANWDDRPFYGPNKEFKLREAVVVTPYEQYNVNSLEGILDNFGSLYQDRAAKEYMDKVRHRVFDQLSQYEVLHNRSAVMRTNAKKENPDGFETTLNVLKKNPGYAPELGKMFVSYDVFKDMSEREKRINVGTEFVFRIFCAQALKDYEVQDYRANGGLGGLDMWGVTLPGVEKYVDKKFNILPYYRTQDKTKLRALYNEIRKDLVKIGLSANDDLGILLCIEGGLSASVGLGIDILLDWEEKYNPTTGKLESTVNASQDAAPKAIYPSYLRSTEKDKEKKKPNIAIADYIGQAVGTYARMACYTYTDDDGTRKRDSLLRITAKGLTRTIDWTTGTTSVDENVSDQFATYYGKIYKPYAFCDPKTAPFTIKLRRTEAFDSAGEMEDLKRYLGIAPEDFFANITESINRKLEQTPIIGHFYGSLDIWKANYLALRPYIDHDGHELQASELQAQAEAYFQPLLVDFRQYWLNSINTDVDTYPWDTVVRLRNLFTTKASVPGRGGAVNDHINEILFNPSLREVEPPKPGEVASPAYEQLTDNVKEVLRKMKAYLKYGLLEEMILYLYMPLYKNNAEFMELKAHTSDPEYKKMIATPTKYDIEKYVVTTTAGFPAFSTREYDVLLGAMREVWERLSNLSKSGDVEGPDDFKYGLGYTTEEPNEPFIKAKALEYIQKKYEAAPGTRYEDVSAVSKRRQPDYQMRPKNERNPGLQGFINLIVLRETVLAQRKTR